MAFTLDRRCRLCSGTIRLIDVFEFESNGLREMIENLLHIYIDKDDVLPKTVCAPCYGRIEQFQIFAKQARETQSELLKDYKVHRERQKIPRRLAVDEKKHKRKKSRKMDLVIELSSDDASGTSLCPESSDVEYDSDIEIVECTTDIKPPKHLDSKKEHVTFETTMVVSPLTEYKPEVTNGIILNHQNIQVGKSLLDEIGFMVTKYRQNNPLALESDTLPMKVINTEEKGTTISENNSFNKGCQIMVVCQLKNCRPVREARRRIVWSSEQKSMMKQHFSAHWGNLTIPSIFEAMNFLDEVNTAFHEVTCFHVRQFFKNRMYRITGPHSDRRNHLW